jgi:hypothetical protein
MWHLNYMVATYLPCKVVNLVHNAWMTTKKNHPSGLKRWSGKFSTMPKSILGKKILSHRCLPLHDHFGVSNEIFPFNKIMNGLCHVKPTQS